MNLLAYVYKLGIADKLTNAERKLIAQATRNSDGRRIDYNDLAQIMILNRARVVAALRKFHKAYGTTAARDLARKLENKRRR